MIVVDASAVVEALGSTHIGREVFATLHRFGGWNAPALIDLEVAHAVRRLVSRGTLAAELATPLLADLLALPMERWDHRALVPRVWELRNVLSAYDAAYVALAENLGAPLLTLDRRLASSSGHRAKVMLATRS